MVFTTDDIIYFIVLTALFGLRIIVTSLMEWRQQY